MKRRKANLAKPDTFALTAILGLLSAIGPLSTDMYLPSLPDIGRTLAASTAQVQLTISAYLLGFAAGQIVYGPLSDRYGRKPVLLFAVSLYCVASVACTLATSIHLLIAARVLQAIGGCGGIVLARAIVRDLYSGARAGREMSVIAMVMGVAPIVSPLVGGMLQTFFGWRANFVLLILLGLEGIALVWWYLPETLKRRSAEPISLLSVLRSYRVILANGSYLAHVALIAMAYAGLFAWLSGASFVLQDLYGLSPFAFSIAFSCGSVGYLTGASIAARVVLKLGLDRVIGLGALALACGGLIMAGAVALGIGSAVTLALGFGVYLVGLGMVLPQGTAAALTPFPERAGAASSLLGVMQQTAASVVGAIVGALLGFSAWPLVLPVALMGCGTLIVWWLTRGVRAAVSRR